MSLVQSGLESVFWENWNSVLSFRTCYSRWTKRLSWGSSMSACSNGQSCGLRIPISLVQSGLGSVQWENWNSVLSFRTCYSRWTKRLSWGSSMRAWSNGQSCGLRIQISLVQSGLRSVFWENWNSILSFRTCYSRRTKRLPWGSSMSAWSNGQSCGLRIQMSLVQSGLGSVFWENWNSVLSFRTCYSRWTKRLSWSSSMSVWSNGQSCGLRIQNDNW